MRGLVASPPSERVSSDGFIARARVYVMETLESWMNRYYRLSRRGKMVLWGIIAVNIALIIAIIMITPHRIGRWFNDVAVAIRDMGPLGMIICCGMVIIASHPPLFGFSASMTLIGFAYGIWPGFLLASVSSMIGAGIAFVSVRRFFPNMIKSNTKWDAFARVMREKGTILVCMIRYCPIPWAMGNGLFASIESVTFPQFMLACLLIQPRLLIPVFIGSRLTSLSDPDAEHDSTHTWLNIISIGLSLTISLATGIFIYKATVRQMKKLEGPAGQEAMEALEEGLLNGYADQTGPELEEEEPLVPTQKKRGGDKSVKKGLGRPDTILRRSSSLHDED